MEAASIPRSISMPLHLGSEDVLGGEQADAGLGTSSTFYHAEETQAISEQAIDETTRLYRERRREERIMRKNALKAYEAENARAAAKERQRLEQNIAESRRKQRVLRKFGSERERLEARLYPTEAALIFINPNPTLGRPYMPRHMLPPMAGMASDANLDLPVRRQANGESPLSRPPSRAPIWQDGEPPKRSKFKPNRTPMLPPAHSRGFGAAAYSGQAMVGCPARASTPYWTRT